MNKVFVIGGVIFLIVIVVILYLIGARSPENNSTTTPTQWSQAGDYKIEETPTGIVVANEKAGFSFTVPEGWKVEGTEGSTFGSYGLVLQSIDSKTSGTRLEEGCKIILETITQKDQVDATTELIKGLQEEPGALPDVELINIGQYPAVQTTLASGTAKNIQIETPLSEENLLDFSVEMRPPSKTICQKGFDSFLSSISIR